MTDRAVPGTYATIDLALAACSGGDRVVLATGTYTNVGIDGYTFSSDVTITSASGNGAILTNCTITSCHHIIFDHLTFQNTIGGDPDTFDDLPNFAVIVGTTGTTNKTACTYIYFHNCIMYGTGGMFTPTDYTQMLIPGRGYGIYGVTHGELTDCIVQNVTQCGHFASTDFQIERNTFRHFRDAFLQSGNLGAGCTYRDNNISFMWPMPGDHGDFIHPFNYTTEICDGLLVEGNFFNADRPASPYLLFESKGSVNSFPNLIVRNNVIRTTTATGMELQKIDTGSIINNTFILNTPDSSHLYDHVNKIVISNSVSTTITYNILGYDPGNTPDASNYVTNQNWVLDDGYTENLFIGGLGYDGMPVQETFPIPGSDIDVSGLGSWEYFGDRDGYPVVYIDCTKHDQTLDWATVDLACGDYDTGDGIPSIGATYAWDFGDGETDTGATTSHTYTSPGEYKITLTVSDESAYTTHKVIRIRSALLCDLGFEQNLNNNAKVQVGTTYENGSPTYSTGNPSGYSIVFNGSLVIAAHAPPPLTGMNQLTIAFDWKGGYQSGKRPFWFAGVYNMTFDGDTIITRLFTPSQNEIYTTIGTSLYDNEWHRIFATYNNGTFKVYFDGTIKSTDSFSGPIINGSDWVYLGGWGSDIATGYMDNLRIYAGSFLPEDEAEKYAALTVGTEQLVYFPSRRRYNRHRW